MPDKFSAVWVSHSSMGDFLKCPRAYYLNNMYRDPSSGRKIQIMNPSLALGAAVHNVIEALSNQPTESRFSESLISQFDTVWRKYAGRLGGFSSSDEEQQYKQRGEEMLRRVMAHPGPLLNKAVKIKESTPWYWLSEEEGIILCGKVDWLEYLPSEDAVHIIDFKTGRKEEDGASLQLPIYYLLVSNTQGRKVAKASYWYLGMNDDLTPQELPDADEAHKDILAIAKKMKLARKLERFVCPHGDAGCFACRPLEKVIRGEAEKVGVSEYNQDIFILHDTSEDISEESVIL
jgi:hypothetical protein